MIFADIDTVVARAMRTWRPPPELSLSEWADRHFVLSAESAAQPGRWRTLPYQRGIMDAITDPAVEQVSLMKSARIGYTLCLSAAIGYHIHHDPASMLVVQPTVEDAKNYSKETIATMLRDVPVLSAIVFKDQEEKGPKDSSATLTHKAFPGGVLSLVGANSGAGFRRISRRLVFFDEVDAYPPSAGSEGDQIRLGIMRTQAFWNRKIVAGSTPLLAGSSRIAELFEGGDQRRYHVPCPHCGHADFLTFREAERGHWMAWPKDEPEKAHFVCCKCGCAIEHKSKRQMVEDGEWVASAPFRGHASFSIWAAYSYSPNASWGQIAQEYVAAAAAGPQQLRTVVNTVLGEVWQERGEAPDWLRLYQRREQYQVATVPEGALFLTAGVDVMRDRLVFEVVAWGADRQSWSVDAGVLPGDTASEAPWDALEELLARGWHGADGAEHHIRMLAVDSGDQTQTVYSWCRRHPMSRVIAVKGVATAKAIISSPSAVDVTVRGKKLSRGYKVWPVGAAIVKSELYGWLRLDARTEEDGGGFPGGYCHFPEHGEEYFRQLTAEHLVEIRSRKGFRTHEWQVLPGRENHWLDCRVYARAAASLLGLDRQAPARREQQPKRDPAPALAPAQNAVERNGVIPRITPSAQASTPVSAPPRPQRPARSGWLHGGRVGGGWLGKR